VPEDSPNVVARRRYLITKSHSLLLRQTGELRYRGNTESWVRELLMAFVVLTTPHSFFGAGSNMGDVVIGDAPNNV